MGFGVSQFISLTDTPLTYLGQGGKHVKVDALGKALEFGTVIPSPLVDLFGGLYEHYYQKLLEDWLEEITGSGTTTYNPSGELTVSTGTTAGSTACRHYIPIVGHTGALYEIDWDKELILQFLISFYQAGAVGTKFGYARLSKNFTAAILGDEGIGFQFLRSGVHLVLASHDGVAREETDLGSSSYHERLLGQKGTVLRIHHRPNGEAKIDFYELNTSGGFDLIGTHTIRVPSGKTNVYLSIAADNAASASEMAVVITHATLYRPLIPVEGV